MINIGPVVLWQVIIFVLLVLGLIIGLLVKTLGGLYFMGANVILLVILFFIAPLIIPPLGNSLNNAIKPLLNNIPQLQTASIIVANWLAIIILYGVWIIGTNTILFSVYIPVLRKQFKKVQINRPINYILGAVFGFCTMMIFTYFLTNLLSTNVFYNKNNFSQDLPTMINATQNDNDKYPNQFRHSAANKMFNWLPSWQVQKSGDAIAYWFWMAITLKNSSSLSDIIDEISNSDNFINNIDDALNGLSDNEKNNVVNEIIGPIVDKIDENTNNLPEAKITWTDINQSVTNWKNNNSNQSFNGAAIETMMTSQPNDESNPYYYFVKLREYGETTSNNSDFSTILTNGNKFYTTLKNIYLLGKITPNADTIQSFNAIVNKYVTEMTIINPGENSPLYANYQQLSSWFA
ncbi:hypothetical protein [Spiroplasma sp. SV19]|uniref:hypothetical protein n=1 Tax=Spiroplasma sp. SV19 TaxID=2570468 RepID=UPI0024B8190A|nr:hypothetical protein [Spiroplasma sp. SV19]WHQ36619.1 hypothetical protein E7Y35_01595 [Spiroplasma sp. SV19]